MPLIDKPLAELKTYNGISPCPDDIDSFWDDALDEMRSVQPDIEIRDSGFSAPYADCYNLFFTGVRGARIHAKYLKPKHVSEPHPGLVEFHGYTGSSGDWTSKLPYAAAGFSVFSLDCRGQGGLSEDSGGVTGNTHNGHIIRGLDDGPDHMLFRHIFLDTAQLAGIAMGMDEVDDTRVCAMGGSQGGGLTVACASLEPRIRRLAPCVPFLTDYRRVWEMDMAKRAYKELSDYFRRCDPVHEREDEAFRRLGYIDVQNISKRIQGEVLWACGLMDEVCPPSTQFAAYNKIPSKKEMVIYPDFGHEGLPGWSDRAFQFITGVL